jgi:hypothetical protein
MKSKWLKVTEIFDLNKSEVVEIIINEKYLR